MKRVSASLHSNIYVNLPYILSELYTQLHIPEPEMKK